MKADKEKLSHIGIEPVYGVHKIKVDLSKLYESQPLSVSLKIDKERMKLLESMPVPEHGGIKVDLCKLEELGLYQRRPRPPERYFTRRYAVIAMGAAACLLFAVYTIFGIVNKPVSDVTESVLVKNETVHDKPDIKVTYIDTEDLSDAGMFALQVLNDGASEDMISEDTVSEDENSDTEQTEETDGEIITEIATEVEQTDIDIVAQEEEKPLLVMANVDTSLNVRADASQDAERIGILYDDCGGTILEQKDGWTKIESGDLVGWANDEYLLFNDEAQAKADDVGNYTATVEASVLNIRMQPDTQSTIIGCALQNDTMTVVEMDDEWAEVEFKNRIGYIHTDYANVEFAINTGTVISEPVEETSEEEISESEETVEISESEETVENEQTDETESETVPEEEPVLSETEIVSDEAAAEEIPAQIPSETVMPEEVTESDTAEIVTEETTDALTEDVAEASDEIPNMGQGINASDEDIDMMAAIIYCESGGEPYEGQVAVGAVVVNRINDPRFPNTVEEVIRAKKQFSPVKSGKFDRVYSTRSWSDSCYAAACEAAAGGKSSVGGALYFKNPKKAGAHAGITIQNHVFW